MNTAIYLVNHNSDNLIGNRKIINMVIVSTCMKNNSCFAYFQQFHIDTHQLISLPVNCILHLNTFKVLEKILK